MSRFLMAGLATAMLAGGVAACAWSEAEPAPAAPVGERVAPSARVASAATLPRLVDLGAGKCVPCKAMAPILEQLKTDYAGRLDVQFIDVWKNPDAAVPYGIHLIPTQIFYGADGRELARHEGFLGRDEILAQWRAVGVKL